MRGNRLRDVQIRWYGKEVMVAATKANVTAMKEAALMLERYIKKHFTVQGTGRRYKKHHASLPGQPPAVDLGVLRASVGHAITKKGDKIIGEVGTDIDKMRAHPKFDIGSDVNYGLYLELGTKNMRPRPWMRPALKKNEAEIEKIFKKANS